MKIFGKRLLSFAMALVMVLSMVPACAFGNHAHATESGKVAEVNGTGYTSLADAITEAGEGDTVKILTDLTNPEVTVKKNVTIDLGGNTVTDAYWVMDKAQVTVENGSIKNTVEPYPLVAQNGATLTINNVAIEASKSDLAIWVREDSALVFNSGSILVTKGENNTKSTISAIKGAKGADITINGGTITVDTPGSSAYGVWANYDDVTVTVNGGKISTTGAGNYNYAIYTYGDITVKDGEIVTGADGKGSYNYALYTTKGNVTVEGGSITTNGNNSYAIYASGSAPQVSITGGEFVSENASTKPALIKTNSSSVVTATIEGGVFEGFDATLLNNSYSSTNTSTVTVKGGTFDVKLADKYIATGATVTMAGTTYTKNEEGELVEVSYAAKIGGTFYESLDAAFAAATEGQTITLLADATPALTSQRKFTAAAVIDLGGKTLTLTEDDLYFGTTTFKNGNIVVDPSVKPSTAVFWMFANQTLTFDAVKLTATGVTGTYLIGLDGDNADLNLINGSEIIVDNETALDLDIICVNAYTGNDIVIDDSKVTVNNLDGRVFFRGNYTVSGNSDIDLSGITKAGFRIEAGQTLTIADTASVDIAGAPRDGGIHLTDASAVYNKADTATVNATVNAPTITYAAKINGVGYTSLADALAAAKTMTGDMVVEIYDKVTLNSSLSGSFDSVKFVGKDTDAEIYLDVQGYTTATGKKVAFEGLILSKAEGGYVANAGFMNVAFGVYDVVEVTYTGCTFANGAYASSGKVTYTGCTFKRSHDKYGLWAYGNAEIVVDGCTFADYRGIKMYAEGGAKTTDLTVKNSDFSAVSDKPAIVLTYGERVVLENNTYSATGVFELDLDGAPNGTPVTTDDVASLTCKNDNGTCGVLVDGKIYTTVAQAAAVATEGSTVTLLHDSAETVELPDGVALDLNGHTAAGITLAGPKGTVTPAYTGEVDGYVRIWGEGGGNAKESYVLKLFAGDKLIATTQLNNVGGIIDGDVYVTWNFFYPASTDEYWTTTWEAGQPNSVDQPTKVELYLDGVKVSENVAKMSGADDLNPVVWENLGGVQKIVTGLQGAGTEADPYLIGCVEELLWFQAKVDEQAADGSTQFAGKYFKLTADINLAGINWNPIGSMSGDHGSFKGVFDGDSHTIKNLNCQQAGNGIGLFARTAGNAQIKNLTLENVTVKSTNNANYVGGVVGNAYASTKISNVHVKGQIDISGRGYIGGIAGHGYVVMDNVSVVGEGTVYSTFWCAGGILGYAGEGATNITNAHVEGLTITSAAGGLGAIVGMAEDNNGTQPISGANLSAKNVQIKTYTGAYGDAYADYALGYLYGGNPTSKLTGELTVDNVSITTSNGVTPSIVDAVATVDSAVYYDLQSAINAAEGKTVKVLRDITLTEALTVTGTVTLDLNGKTITGKPVEAKAFSVIENRGVLTITGNGAVVCDHQLAGSTAYAVNTITNGGALIIDGATIENKSTAAYQIGYAIDNNSTTGNATVEIKNGEVKASGSNYYDGIRLFCNSQVNENAVTVTGGTVSSIWLQNPSDGTVKDTKDVKGSVTISGGTVNALYLEPSAAFEADISGGYVGSVSYFATSEGRDLTGFISGGTFGAPVAEAFCAEGYIPVDNGDGTYGVKIGLPQVEITDVKDTLDGEDPDLTFALNFAIANVENLTDEYLNELFETYGDYYVDYVLTIGGLDGDTVTFNANGSADGYLAGQYDAWSENWVTVPFDDVVVEDGQGLYIMEYAAKLMNKQGLRFTLAEVAAIVQNFDCGVYFTPEFLAEHPDLHVKLQLKVFTEDAEGNKIENIDVATNEFENNYAAIVTGEGKQTQYFATFAEAYAAAQAGDTVELLGNVTLTGKLTVTEPVTIDGNGFSIIANHTAFILETSADCTFKDITLDTNNMAKGVKIASGNVVFDNVTIPNSNKSDAITVKGSLTIKNYFSVESTYQVFDAREGSVTAEPGTVFDFTSRIGLASPTKCDFKSVVDTEGKPFFCAYASTTYYTSLTALSYKDLTLLDDVTINNNPTVSGTLDLNGHDLTVADGKALKVSGNLTITGEGNFSGDIQLTSKTAAVTAAMNLNVASGVEGYKAVYENGTYKLAEISYVAEVGGVKYETLQDAIDAAQEGETVKVLKDIALTAGVVVPADKNIVLDLNGMTVSMETADDAKYYLIYNKGNLTITDSGENGKLSYHYTGTNSGDAYNTVESAPGSVLTVQGGTIENLSTCLIAYAIDGLTNGSGGDVTVNIAGGKITSKKIAVRIFANSTTNTGTLNISDGEIYGRVIIQNANANANKAVLDITGGAFHTNGYKTDVLYVGGSNGNADGMTASVSGGIFNGEILSSIGQGFISGGAFSSAVAEEHWAEGKHVADVDGDGIYTVHAEDAGETVVENNVAPDCENAGSYDNVVYCEVCGHEMSRDTVTVDALGHSYTNYIYNNNATTSADGTETAACDHGCGKTDTRVAVGTKLEANKVAYIIVDGEKVYYEDLQDAIDNALDGQTVYLNADAREVSLDVYENITLDLNGYTLTVVRQATANGEIKGEGLLAAPQNKTILNGQISALPVWNGSGYYFAAAPDMSRVMISNGQFVFQPLFSDDVKVLFVNGTADEAGLKIVVALTYELSGNTFTMEYEVPADKAQDIISKNQTFGLIIEEDFQNLTYTAKVVSDTGAVFSAVTVS